MTDKLTVKEDREFAWLDARDMLWRLHKIGTGLTEQEQKRLQELCDRWTRYGVNRDGVMVQRDDVCSASRKCESDSR